MKRLIVSALAGILLATGCSNSDGGSVQSLRAAAGVIATPQASPPTETPPAPPQPTETPPAISTEMPQPPRVIEVTREVQATVQVEVTRVVVQEIQVTPAVMPPSSGIDESIQPCPAKYWRKGRCIATQAQIDAYTQGTVQP